MLSKDLERLTNADMFSAAFRNCAFLFDYCLFFRLLPLIASL